MAVVKKKNKVKQAAKKKTVKRKPRQPSLKKREVWGHEEMRVEETKFSPTPPEIKPALYQQPAQELPSCYGEDKIVLQVRDPWWLYAYWEVTLTTWDNLKRQLGERFNSAKLILRVYDISHIIFNGKNAHCFFDIEVNHQANNWYIDTAGPGRSWCVDIGLRLATGEFIMIARSNSVSTPLDGPSWITDEEWMIPDDLFARLYGMGFGLGKSSPIGKAWQERVRKALFSGILSSRISSRQK